MRFIKLLFGLILMAAVISYYVYDFLLVESLPFGLRPLESLKIVLLGYLPAFLALLGLLVLWTEISEWSSGEVSTKKYHAEEKEEEKHEKKEKVEEKEEVKRTIKMTAQPLTKIEGIGPTYEKKLKKIGIEDTQLLLQRGATAEGREEISGKTKIGKGMILTWINQADLSRIKGVSEEYAQLLEAGGVDSIPELARRDPENLHKQLTSVNKKKKLVRRLPFKTEVGRWVTHAKKLPKVVTH